MTISALITSLLTDYGYSSLFITSFLSSSLIPMGSETIVAAMVLVPGANFFKIIFVATLGNFLGSCTTYYIGYKGTNHILYKYLAVDPEKIDKANRSFKKYGFWLLLLTWVPVVGDAFVFAAGSVRYSPWRFAVLTIIGKLFRYLFIGIAMNVIIL